ncbi:unnamed protein product [Closterium sp. NIES-53]
MPGTSWIDALVAADCRLEICTASKTILSVDDILQLIGDRCDGVIGQLTEEWGERLFAALARAGGRAYSNMAVGFNNVDVDAATRHSISVGNTPVSAARAREWSLAARLAIPLAAAVGDGQQQQQQQQQQHRSR